MPHNIVSKILLVDDLKENLLALDALVRGPKREIFKATSGEAALALMLEHEFALALLDVQMPSMNGFELAELMRGTERTRQIPIIFVSAAGSELNYAFKGYESGAVDFLQKPLDPHVVRSKVNAFVELHANRRALQRELEHQNALVHDLQAARQDLEHAVRMRDDFMSMVSHELRTPLNTLLLETQLRKLHLARGTVGSFTPDKLLNMVERDQRHIQNMVRLIDDMLDVTRMRRGRLSMKPQACDMAALALRVVEGLGQQAESVGVALHLNAPTPVPGIWDEFRIEQVLTNLLTNALRYGGGKPVHIEVGRADDQARLQVRDEGPGIPPEDHARIFEQFQRAESGRHHTGGLGLGLYITRQIVEIHGGSIQVCSQPGEGACFEVLLPLTPPITSA